MHPLTDDQIWGTNETQEVSCPLMEDGCCPEGCIECLLYQMEIEGLAAKAQSREERMQDG